MKQIKCGILHADGKVARRIAGFIEQTPFLSLSANHTSPAEILSACHQKQVDLLYCSIDGDMEEIKSFRNSLDVSIPVIFISADKKRAFDGFRMNALDFLLPSDPYHIFLTSANKALHHLSLQVSEEAQPRHIYIKSDYQIVRLEFDTIDYIESYDDYVKIHCNNREKAILSLCSLKKLESILPASEFIRVHRSYIVRKQSISVVENRSIIFPKTRIPVSKASLKLLQEYIQILSLG